MPFFPKFAEDVWNQLKRCKKVPRHDKLVTASMRFLSSVVKRNMHRKVFESPQALLSMIRDVVVPNLMLRENDEEMLEDNPLEYIRVDIEGSDASTRRRAACDLVRALCVQFNDQIAPICVNFIDQMMKQYVCSDFNFVRFFFFNLYLTVSLTYSPTHSHTHPLNTDIMPIEMQTGN